MSMKNPFIKNKELESQSATVEETNCSSCLGAENTNSSPQLTEFFATKEPSFDEPLKPMPIGSADQALEPAKAQTTNTSRKPDSDRERELELERMEYEGGHAP